MRERGGLELALYFALSVSPASALDVSLFFFFFNARCVVHGVIYESESYVDDDATTMTAHCREAPFPGLPIFFHSLSLEILFFVTSLFFFSPCYPFFHPRAYSDTSIRLFLCLSLSLSPSLSLSLGAGAEERNAKRMVYYARPQLYNNPFFSTVLQIRGDVVP